MQRHKSKKIVKMESFLQNPHDHPLMLIFKGNNVQYVVTLFKAVYPSECIFELQNHNSKTIMRDLMPLHFKNRDKDYFVSCSLSESQLFVAFNHIFHDLKSIDQLLSRVPVKEFAVTPPSAVKRVPDPSESRGFYPIKMTNIIVSSDLMAKVIKQYQISANECLFWLLASSLPPSSQVMCLHNMRKKLGKQNEVGGDYSCFTEPLLLLPSASNETASWPCVALLPPITNYFKQIRNNELVLQENNRHKSFRGVWMYDSWIGTNIAQPFPSDNKEIVLDIATLMSMYIMVVENLAITIRLPDDGGYQLVMFSDEVVVPVNPSETLSALVA